MTIFDSKLLSKQNAEIIFISVIGGAAGNAMFSYIVDVDWIGERRAAVTAAGLALVSGLVLWTNRNKLTGLAPTF